MEEMNLDFLRSMQNHPNEQAFNEFDVKLGKNIYGSKRYEMAQTIAKVDDLLQEIDKLKSQNIQLQQQLKDFQVTAQQVQELYTREKEEHFIAKCNLNKLQKEYHKIDVELTNMSMVNEQLKARLANYDGRPVNFDSLAVKYIKIINKLEGHDVLKYYPDKDLVEKLREYCAAMKLKIPPANSPRKSRSRGNKIKTEEAAVQCNLLKETCRKTKAKDQNTQYSTTKRDQACQYSSTMTVKCDLLEENSLKMLDCPTCKTNHKVHNQNTQCSTAKRDQASQYISTMITRQTNTEKIIQKHVQTMFPEPPAIDDILKVYSRWSNIRSVSPLLSPSHICSASSKEMSKKCWTTGTCTMLCNIRRRIDYLPLNNSSNIKQETFTPSVSPTPTSYPIRRNRSRVRSTSNIEPGNINSSLLNLFNSTTNSSLENLSSNAFNELWHIFGKMLLSLLQTGNAGIANTTQNSPLNQQQFLDWLLELYMNSQPQTASTVQTQTLKQRDHNILSRPLFFNDASTLSANVMRPQPQKALPKQNATGSSVRKNESYISSSNSIDNNNCNSQIPIADTSNRPLRSSAHDSDFINGDLQQIQINSNTNGLQTKNICESICNKLTKKTKIKAKILDQIQELLPEINLNKKKRKTLKRLLKSNNHRKKAFETRKAKDLNKQSAVVTLTNENFDDTVETAVDFLKTFAVTQQSNRPLEDNFSETEKMFLKQISSENITNNVLNVSTSEKLDFINPSRSLTHTQPTSNTCGDILKCKKLKSSQEINQKYELLFGESDDVFEDEEMKTETSKLNTKPVIKCNFIECKKSTSNKLRNLNYSQDCASLEVAKSANYDQQRSCRVKATESANLSIEKYSKKTRHTTLQQQSSSAKTPTPVLDNSHNINSSQETSIPEIPIQSLKDLEYTYLPEDFPLKNAQYSKYFSLDANKQILNPSSKTNCYSLADIENSLANDLDDEYAAKINEISNTKAKLSKDSVTIKEIKAVYDINYYTEQNVALPQVFENYDERDKSTTENCTKSVSNLTEDDYSYDCISHQIISSSTSLVEPDKSITENLNEDDSSNGSKNSNKIIINSKPMYSSDFEKDFELSSDNESVMSENDLNDIKKINYTTIEQPKEIEFCEESFNSTSSSVSENDGSEKSKTDIKSMKNFEPKDFELTNSRISLNNFVLNSSNESQDSIISFGGNEENLKKIMNCKPKQENVLSINNSEDILELKFDGGAKKINEEVKTEGKDNLFNNCKLHNGSFNQSIPNLADNYLKTEHEKENENMLTTALKSSSTRTRQSHYTESKSINKSSSDECSAVCSVVTISDFTSNGESLNVNEITQTATKKNDLDNEGANIVSEDITLKYSGDKNYLTTENGGEIENILENPSKYGRTRLRQSYYTASESINNINSEENSLVFSVVTVSDSTLNGEALNIDEITQTSIRKNCNDDDPKGSNLSNLKLSDQKLSYNSMINKADNGVSIIQDKLDTCQILNTKNTINSPYKSILENALKSSNTRLRQSHFIESENINQRSSKEKSSVCSVITVSDSTLNGESLNVDEISQTPKMKNDNDNVPKVSNLSNLKLLAYNKIYNHQKHSYNCITNKAINEVISIQDKSDIDQILKAENTINSPYDGEVAEIKPRTNINNIKMFEYSNMSAIDEKEPVIILSCSTISKSSLTNISENHIKGSACQKDLNIANKQNSGISPTHVNINEQNINCNLVIKSSLANLEFSDIESFPNNVPNLHTVDGIDSSDSLSIDNELMIDEEPSNDNSKQSTADPLNISILTESENDCYDTTSSSNISTLLNSTLLSEVLTESLNPIVDDLLKDELVTTSITPEVKPKRGRKRKSECLAELQPYKRSQRLKAKQMILEKSLNLAKTAIELGKYTNRGNNVINNVQLKSPIEEYMKKKYIQPKSETIKKIKFLENENTVQLGFFKERAIEEEATVDENKTSSLIKSQEPKPSGNKAFAISYESEIKQQQQQDQISLESEKQNNRTTIECVREREKYNKQTFTMSYEAKTVYTQLQQGQLCRDSEKQESQTIVTALQEWKKCNSPKDCISIEPLENVIYSDSPQSPAATQTDNEVTPETFVVIPLERPAHFMPQDNILTLFDVLISSYKNENKKQFLDSVTTKEFKRKEGILIKFGEEIKLYCYTEMELDLYCTSTSLINKLLSIYPDYDLIQKALITVAQNAEETNIHDNNLPSIIQEMPPHHLSKCLQRLFIFLKNMVTRNSNFCQDLINKIESLLFNSKQIENLSLQAVLNLTQLYLMAIKVQEYLQIPKHPARLFIAKCLYFHLHKAPLMIHEVLMWYPTVLPYREDKTYDRSDALISVIQQILMSTKYEMFIPELRGKVLLSKLRYEYHFEPFKPSAEEVITVLVEKLKNSKFYNISLAFGLLCKRMGAIKTQNVLNHHMIPLANEYYSLALKTNEYDKRIAVLLEIISMLIKPLPIGTDTQKYFSEFTRFLNGFERQDIQEAALCSILRLQRFNVECCYNLLRHFQPTYNLNTHTQAMLKTFLYRHPPGFWKNLKMQNLKNFN